MVTQARGGNGLNKKGSAGDGDKVLHSRCIVKVEWTGFTAGLESRREKEKTRIKMMGTSPIL